MKKSVKILIALAGLSITGLLFFLVVAAGVMLHRHADSGRIAVVNVKGAVSDSRNIVELIRDYDRNPRVRAIVVRIDSPGGGVAATQEIYSELDRIRVRGEKPVVASFGGVAASGGYYIACAAERIVSNPGTITGNIGVLISTVSMDELFGKIGIDFSTVKSGDFKDTGTSSRKITGEEESLLQELVDSIHCQFSAVVRERRGLSEEQMEVVSDGRVLSGAQALELNLVDRLGTLHDAIEDAASLAGITRWEVIEQKPRRGLWQVIFGTAAGGLGRLMVPLYLFEGAR